MHRAYRCRGKHSTYLLKNIDCFAPKKYFMNRTLPIILIVCAVHALPLTLLFGQEGQRGQGVQNPDPNGAISQSSAAQQQQQGGVAPTLLSPESLSQLLSPIALYPDALIALILPASTTPGDLVLADRYVSSNGDPALLVSQPWDESVKALTRYPTLLSWMDQNLAWTTSLGETFAAQPADVMNTIQTLRNQAQAQGNLVDTPQQKVVVEGPSILILQADPQVIYVPQYNPSVVYTQPCAPGYTLITFGVGCAVGSWLAYDFDWHHRCLYHDHWRGEQHGGNGNNNNPVLPGTVPHNSANVWHPNPRIAQQIAQRQYTPGGNAPVAQPRVGFTNIHTGIQNMRLKPSQPSVPMPQPAPQAPQAPINSLRPTNPSTERSVQNSLPRPSAPPLLNRNISQQTPPQHPQTSPPNLHINREPSPQLHSQTLTREVHQSLPLHAPVVEMTVHHPSSTTAPPVAHIPPATKQEPPTHSVTPKPSASPSH
jgi:hypothetical protein